MKIFNSLLPFTDFLYILQLEEYSTRRLFNWLPRFFFRRNIQQRARLVLTKLALIMLVISIGMWGVFSLFAVYAFRATFFLAFPLLFLLALLAPFYVLLANLAFSLAEGVLKQKLRRRAAYLVSKNKTMKVVAIAGSYGKTTVKNFVYQLARFTYKTQMIPGNINTPAGIADWIIRYLDENTELLVAEVDAYEVGEIAKSCDILNADIAVLTNIGDQHLQRFRDQQELALALTEVFTHSKSTSIKLSTTSTKPQISPSAGKVIFLDSNTVLTYKGKALQSPQLSQSNISNLEIALKVAEYLEVQESFIIDTIATLELPDRRQREGTILGYDGIDDSYNISFTTAQAGITAAKEYATRRKKKLLVITAGIPELSIENQDKNRELGKILAEQADFVIILGSIFAQEIESGFVSADNYRVVPTLRHFLSVDAQNFEKDEWSPTGAVSLYP